jgi:C4-type Zn-finger protein
MADKNLANDACPVCGSTSIEGWEVTIEGSLAIQECACCECGASWNDVYELAERVVTGRPRPAPPRDD